MQYKYLDPIDPTPIGKQSGSALIIIVLLVLVVASAVLVSQLSSTPHLLRTNETSAVSLKLAKQALLGWSSAHPDNPGLLPFPDLASDGNYNGDSNCNAAPLANNHLLGRLPWNAQAVPCVPPLTSLGKRFVDGSGELLWYAVSRNLVHDAFLNIAPTINSDLRARNTGWITVIDENGNVLSNRVAFVLIAPGMNLSTQDRSGTTPTPAQYLDSIVIKGTNYSNADYDQVFVQAPASVGFNDILTYVTVDELLGVVETRILRELKHCLDNFALGSGGYYPWPESLTNNGKGNSNNNGKGKPKGIGKGGFKGGGKGGGGGGGGGDDSFGRFDAINVVWPSSCVINKAFWTNWTETSFYKIADGFSANGALTCPTCLTLNSTGNIRALVFLAGISLGGQIRSSAADKTTVSNYLEGNNTTTTDDVFELKPTDSIFNDKLICLDGNSACK